MSYVYYPTVLTRNHTGEGASSGKVRYDVTPDKIKVYDDTGVKELKNVTSGVLTEIEIACQRHNDAGTQETPQRLLAYAYKNGCKEYWDKYKDTPLAIKALEEIVKGP